MDEKQREERKGRRMGAVRGGTWSRVRILSVISISSSLITSAYTPLLSSPSILSDQYRPVYLCTRSPYPLCTYPAFQARRHVHQHKCRSTTTGSFCAVRSLSASSRLRGGWMGFCVF